MTATQPGIHLDVPEPPTPDGQVITDYLVQVASGSYPSPWPFGDDELNDAVEKWADEGMDRCSLSAHAVTPDDGTEYPREFRATFTRTRGWSAWEEV